MTEIKHQITHDPSFSLLRIDLEQGQEFVTEAGSMVARDPQLSVETKLNGSEGVGIFQKMLAIFVALIRKFIAGETFFVNHFSTTQKGSIWIAPTMSGQIKHRILKGETILLSTGAYLAHTGNLKIGIKFGGLKSLLAKEGAFFLKISGDGELFYSSYGGIETVEVDGSLMVDNGHLVGFEGNLSFNIKTAGGGLMGFVASGEGIVCEFQGKGVVHLQSRNSDSLTSWLIPLMPN